MDLAGGKLFAHIYSPPSPHTDRSRQQAFYISTIIISVEWICSRNGRCFPRARERCLIAVLYVYSLSIATLRGPRAKSYTPTCADLFRPPVRAAERTSVRDVGGLQEMKAGEGTQVKGGIGSGRLNEDTERTPQ
ncbi:hypothetical protein JOB18_012859 [Solea senegalensis]|uniref:Uncharacterized protein n=1 Tax=Solea senegalensis TaxID=28829 RepID=A0AAV6S0M8_SOLSE|nr:hypothetical protein JOB18_012859 [Solea senegalensis]